MTVPGQLPGEPAVAGSQIEDIQGAATGADGEQSEQSLEGTGTAAPDCPVRCAGRRIGEKAEVRWIDGSILRVPYTKVVLQEWTIRRKAAVGDQRHNTVYDGKAASADRAAHGRPGIPVCVC